MRLTWTASPSPQLCTVKFPYSFPRAEAGARRKTDTHVAPSPVDPSHRPKVAINQGSTDGLTVSRAQSPSMHWLACRCLSWESWRARKITGPVSLAAGLAGKTDTELAVSLIPEDWAAGGSFPLVVERRRDARGLLRRGVWRSQGSQDAGGPLPPL